MNQKKTIGILTKVFCTSGLNLVILAWTGEKLSHGQARGWHTEGRMDGRTHTHAGNDNTRSPKPASGENDEYDGDEDNECDNDSDSDNKECFKPNKALWAQKKMFSLNSIL